MHYAKHVFLCTNQKSTGQACCANTGGASFFIYLKNKLKELDQHGPGKVRISQSGCLGRCGLGPCLVIYPDAVWYTYQSNADLDEIITNHLINSRVVTRLLIDKSAVS